MNLKTPGYPGKPDYFANTPVWVGMSDTYSGSLGIKVRAESDAHILLSCEGEKKALEVVVGGWNNSQSEIRRGAQGMPIATVFHEQTNPALDPKKFRDVRISWMRESAGIRLIVQVAGKTLNILEKSKKIKDIKAVYVSTGFGFDGEWKVTREAGDAEEGDYHQTPKTSRSSIRQPFMSGPVSQVASPKENFRALNPNFSQTPMNSLLKRRRQNSEPAPVASEQSDYSNESPFPRTREDSKLERSLFSVISQFE